MKKLMWICLLLCTAYSYAIVNPVLLNGKLYLNNKKLIFEFNGTLSTINNKIYLDNVIVGKIENGYASFCKDELQFVCKYSISIKNPEIDDHQGSLIRTISIKLNQPEKMIGKINKNLIPYILNSPNQQGAGSCLFMASTGALETLLNKANGIPGILDGDTDLSERFLMNITTFKDVHVENWKTDTVLLFNEIGGGVLNRDYRYTAGYYSEDLEGNIVAVDENHDGAEYGPYYNWITDLNFDYKNTMIDLPLIQRDILFEDVDNNQWNTGLMGDAEVQRIKDELDQKNAPVLAIYNHYGYWHAVIIVGYNDNQETEECPFVKSWFEYMDGEAETYLLSANEDEVARGNRIKKYVDRVELSMQEKGCGTSGVFYIRDSIYRGSDDLIYDYDLANEGEEAPYAKKVIEKSYDWIKHLANHLYVIY